MRYRLGLALDFGTSRLFGFGLSRYTDTLESGWIRHGDGSALGPLGARCRAGPNQTPRETRRIF